jgi:hypothetical protein
MKMKRKWNQNEMKMIWKWNENEMKWKWNEIKGSLKPRTPSSIAVFFESIKCNEMKWK